MANYQDRYWNSPDGLRLHYRDYDGPRDRPPILCIPGLTRNARDFAPVADHFAGEWRVLVVDLRGRGLSEHDPKPANYVPQTYAGDLLKLLDQLGIADAVFVGTSLGGIVTMVMAMRDAERIAGALLNDVGPEIDPRGLDRIGSYVGKASTYTSFDQLARDVAARNADTFPDYTPDQWDAFVRCVASERGGKVEFDYDLAIANNFEASRGAPAADIWPYYRALAGRPVTLIRGELTDLLEAEVAERMAREIPDVELVTVPRVGHAPALDEPESLAAIERLLVRVLAREEAGA
jgi:pimeloyl-ACP methyl ester carboxylesterase